MSIDCCEGCGEMIDTDDYPDVYRRDLDNQCLCDDCYADTEVLCGQCNGSGEGMYDGTICYRCKGSGVLK